MFVSKIFHFSIGRFFECFQLYRNDMIECDYHETISEANGFRFFMPTAEHLPLFEKLYEGSPDKIEVIKKRYSSGNYLCFAYQDEITDRIAYARWLCKNNFYSEPMRRELSFNNDEALTLDSYTHPDYRFKGLHKKNNILMLKWIKDNTSIGHVYMVIGCFIPHLSKIPLELGYRPTNRKFNYKKGSFSIFIKHLVRS